MPTPDENRTSQMPHDRARGRAESPTSSSKIAKSWIKISGCEAIRKPKGSENDRNEEPKLKESSNGTSEVTPTKPNR